MGRHCCAPKGQWRRRFAIVAALSHAGHSVAMMEHGLFRCTCNQHTMASGTVAHCLRSHVRSTSKTHPVDVARSLATNLLCSRLNLQDRSVSRQPGYAFYSASEPRTPYKGAWKRVFAVASVLMSATPACVLNSASVTHSFRESPPGNQINPTRETDHYAASRLPSAVG